MRGTKGFMVSALAALLVLGAASLRAGEEPSPEAIQNAKTAADHNAIADAYAKQAAELRQKAADHKAMLASYEKGPGYLIHKAGLGQHCQSLIGHYEKAAADAEALAKMHRTMAAEAKP